MTTPAALAPKTSMHPLMATAAIAVTTFSLAGIAAMTGLLPSSQATPSPAPAAVATAPATPAAPVALPAVSPAPTSAEPPAVVKPRVIEKIVYVDRPAPKPVAKETPAEPAVAPQPALAQTPPAPPVALPPASPIAATPPPAPVCATCGTVDTIREIAQPGDASGLGAVLGGVAGGLLGSQVGGGNGKKLAAVLAAAGGAYAGHQYEKSRKETKRYEVAVRMEDGTMRSVTEDNMPVWRIGDRVSLDNGRLASAR